MATNTPHSMATEHLPMFISGPGETDVFFIVVVVIVILVAMLFGALYLTLHALPEKMAHRVNSTQILLIGVLSLIGLFMHNNYFFIAALLLAVVRLPDWATPLNSIAKSLEAQLLIFSTNPPTPPETKAKASPAKPKTKRAAATKKAKSTSRGA
jgi:hypothetical protein